MSPHSELSLDGSNGLSDACPPMLNTLSNGLSNDHQPMSTSQASPSQYLPPADLDADLDLICVGFGPASLAIAVALHDALAAGQTLLHNGSAPRVLFLEKQPRFAWHAGMLLPGAKMQISFIKDLATLRDPRSEFTFLNYLHRNGRLVEFSNLGTFLPARAEYEDYLRWSASHFDHLVQYGQEVDSVHPEAVVAGKSVQLFTVESRNVETGQRNTFRARNILLATGGQPKFPPIFPDPGRSSRIIHSSQYAHVVPRLLPGKQSPCRVAVVGAGQSAAEIFCNIQKLYPNSTTSLIMRQGFLRPSDDSPFVNSVFNPEYVDTLFPKSAQHRNNFLTEVRATNYGVVRLELIEELYEIMYHQRRQLGPIERDWPHRIMGGRHITSVTPHGETIELRVKRVVDSELESSSDESEEEEGETLEVDLLIAATGYQRNAHVEMLKDTWDLLPEASSTHRDFSHGITGWNVETQRGERRKMAVGRDYQVKYMPGAVAKGSGIWLQGCCEGTHGLSDTLLSVLATRSGEIVDSIFNAWSPEPSGILVNE